MNTTLNKTLLIFFILTSCASKKDLYYFQDIDYIDINNNYNYLNIQPGDILDIQIKALNPESVLIFQRQAVLMQQNVQFQNRSIDGYLVGDDNTINLPLIGSISTFELNTSSLSEKIVQKLTPYVKDPSVNVRILNFRVSILGEVTKPGTYTFLEERVSIPQALGQAGDLTINGNRNSVLLIRDINGNKTSQFIDLTKSDFINSSNYYLKQNDVLYIRPNNAKIKSSGLVGNASTLVSILSLAVSLFIVITR
jgi:polysaccharide export outer membrane protein